MLAVAGGVGYHQHPVPLKFQDGKNMR